MTKVSNVRKGKADAAPVGEEPQNERAAQATVGIVYVTDTLKRRFGIKKMRPSQRFELNEIVNSQTMGGVLTYLMVGSLVSIDEEGYAPVRTKPEFLERLDEIGDEGEAAITPVLLKMYGIELNKMEQDLAKN